MVLLDTHLRPLLRLSNLRLVLMFRDLSLSGKILSADDNSLETTFPFLACVH